MSMHFAQRSSNPENDQFWDHGVEMSTCNVWKTWAGKCCVLINIGYYIVILCADVIDTFNAFFIMVEGGVKDERIC